MSVQVSSEGCSYGKLEIVNTELQLISAVSSKNIFVMKLDNVSQCVVPANNRDDIEIQFADSQARERVEDCLVQFTLHFPKDETEDGLTIAEDYHKQIMDTGAIKSVTGDIIVEFSKEQGNFVAPRGKYALQLTSNYMHMQGAQYAYKIPYTDMDSFFLLEKAEGGRSAFVISLKKPIRQGNQKYQNLVIETHSIETTVQVNLTQAEIDEKYEGKLSPEMTMPMAHLFGKLFKVITNVKVFMPKQFLSARNAHSIRCSIKANEGLLYPLAKCFIFIHKPTIIVKFDDIEIVEFRRYEPVANSATRNFDLAITMKESAVGAGEWKEYVFMSIDRSEYVSIFDYIQSKEIKIKNPQPAAAHVDLGPDDDDEDEDEDEDYNSAKGSNQSDDDEGSESGSGSDEGSEQEEKPKKEAKVKKEKVKKEKKEKPEKSSKKRKGEDEDGKGKKKRAKKDKNAPRGALTAFMAYSNSIRPEVKAANPSMGITDIAKEIGSRWRALTPEEKEPFDKLSREDRERFKEEMKTYLANKKGESAGDDGEENEEDQDAGEEENNEVDIE